MANDAAGTTWSESEPALTDPRFLGQQEIRGLRTGVRLRTAREHETFAGASAGGEHKTGSAKAYNETGTGPTLRPDGVTALTAADAGRIWRDVDDGQLNLYTGTAWKPLRPQPKRNTTDPEATVFTAGGWTNTTGNTVIAHVSGAISGAGPQVLEVDYNDGNGFTAVAQTFTTGTSFASFAASILVPATGKLRGNFTPANAYVRIQEIINIAL